MSLRDKKFEAAYTGLEIYPAKDVDAAVKELRCRLIDEDGKSSFAVVALNDVFGCEKQELCKNNEHSDHKYKGIETCKRCRINTCHANFAYHVCPVLQEPKRKNG